MRTPFLAALAVAAACNSDTATAPQSTTSDNPPASIAAPTSLSLTAGSSEPLRFFVIAANGDTIVNPTIHSASSNPAVAVLNETHDVQAGVAGTALITLTAVDASGAELPNVQLQLAVTVELPAMYGILINAPPTEVLAGDSFDLTATPVDGSGAPIRGYDVLWASGDPSIATVDAVGHVSAIGAGTVAITASAEGFTSDVVFVVNERVAVSLAATPSDTALIVGTTARIAATAVDAHNRVIENAPVSFVSEDPRIATVDDAGNVTAIGAGSTVILVSIGAIAVSVPITVQ